MNLRLQINALTEGEYAVAKRDVDRLRVELGQQPLPSLQSTLDEKSAQLRMIPYSTVIRSSGVFLFLTRHHSVPLTMGVKKRWPRPTVRLSTDFFESALEGYGFITFIEACDPPYGSLQRIYITGTLMNGD